MQGLVFIAVTAAGLFVACLNSSLFLVYGVYCTQGDRTAPLEKPLARIAFVFIAYGAGAGAMLGVMVLSGSIPEPATEIALTLAAAPPTIVAASVLKRVTQSRAVARATLLGGAISMGVLATSVVGVDPRSLFVVIFVASIAWHLCCARALVRWARRTREHGAKFCLTCGYSLEGLNAPICPECGEQISPLPAGEGVNAMR